MKRSLFQLQLQLLFKDLWFLFLVLIAFTLPFTILLNNIFIILFCIVSLVNIFYYKKYKLKNRNLLILFLILYFVHFIGFLNSDNIGAVFFEFEQKASLLVFPLIIGFSPVIKNKHVYIILIFFTLATTVASLITFRDGIYPAWQDLSIQYKLILHRPYIGLYCVASIFFLGHLFNKLNTNRLKIFVILLMAYHLCFIVLVLAKMSIIAFVLALSICFSLQLYFNKKFKILFSVIAVVLCIFLYLILLDNKISQGLVNIFTLKAFSWENYDSLLVNSFNIRFVIWDCALQVLNTDLNWILGAGIENSEELLISCYTNKFGSSFFSEMAYNPHNQYLSFWIKFGLLIFIIFTFKLITLFIIAVKGKKLMPLAFIIVIGVVCMSESMLEVQKGVVFYSFFSTILFLNEPSTTKK